jgi:hypothetical protein
MQEDAQLPSTSSEDDISKVQEFIKSDPFFIYNVIEADF